WTFNIFICRSVRGSHWPRIFRPNDPPRFERIGLYKMASVVNIRYDECDVFIGRRRPFGHKDEGKWGNPFSHASRAHGTILVRNRDQAVEYYARWLDGDPVVCALLPPWGPARRDWILAHVHELHGKRLGCYCVPENCHGHVLARLAARA